MIPSYITDDLRAGAGLEETLIKYGVSLKELFQSPRGHKSVNDDTFIQKMSDESFRVHKVLGDRYIHFGTYQSHKDALIVRDELIKTGWDETQLESILEKHGIKRRQKGGYRK